MNKTLTRTQIYINTEDLNNAKNLAKSQKITLSEFIRGAVKEQTEKQQTKLVKPVIRPIIVNGGKPTNIAATHNDIYDY